MVHVWIENEVKQVNFTLYIYIYFLSTLKAIDLFVCNIIFKVHTSRNLHFTTEFSLPLS